MEHAIAGGTAALATCIVLQPLDVVKTRLQQGKRTPTASLFKDNIPGTKFTGRIPELWRGTIPTIIRTVPGASFYFFSLERTRHHAGTFSQKYSLTGLYNVKNGRPGALLNFFTGAFSRLVVGFIFMPLTVIKTRMESNLYYYSNVIIAISSIYKQDGIKMLFKGFVATSIRDAPYAGIYLALYEMFKQYPSYHLFSDSSIPSAFLASSIATSITHPADVIKSRLQLKPNQYLGIWNCFIQIRSEGWKSFFSGFIPRCTRKSIQTTITWTLYERFISWYQRNY